jgi:hypothetical protein
MHPHFFSVVSSVIGAGVQGQTNSCFLASNPPPELYRISSLFYQVVSTHMVFCFYGAEETETERDMVSHVSHSTKLWDGSLFLCCLRLQQQVLKDLLYFSYLSQ